MFEKNYMILGNDLIFQTICFRLNDFNVSNHFYNRFILMSPNIIEYHIQKCTLQYSPLLFTREPITIRVNICLLLKIIYSDSMS